MAHSCSKPDCTVAATGTCLLLNQPLSACPNYLGTNPPAPERDAAEPSGEPESADGQEVARRFFSGFELGAADAAEIMRASYGTLIAVLGSYDVGKTCFLSSLYLMTAARAIGPDLAFAGSLTLNGFETRARRLREWKNGALPKQLADHTVLADERSASLMHLALRERADELRRFDLLITDLPGEWSTDLVKDAGTADRFTFLSRADGIVLTLDGPMLLGPERHAVAHDAKVLLTRLADTLNIDRSIPFVLMITKSDEVAMTPPPIVTAIASHATSAGFSPIIISVAAVSRTPAEVKSGAGVMDVIEHFLARKRVPTVREATVGRSARQRHFARIRN